MFILDLEDLHPSLIPSIQSFGSLALPDLLCPGSGVAQDHSLVTQNILQLKLCVLLDAVLQEDPAEGLCFRGILGLNERSERLGDGLILY